jgi:hypothetical protein
MNCLFWNKDLWTGGLLGWLDWRIVAWAFSLSPYYSLRWPMA